MLIAVLAQIGDVDLRAVVALIPVSPLFWLVFPACYFAITISEWIIFRRLWGLPAEGFLALTRKRIGNEVLLGYIGEVYFYAWARKRSRMVGAPFGAVKDVAILSAVAGNVVTLAMLAIAWPLFGSEALGVGGDVLRWSTVVLVGTSIVAMFFRRRLFSLPGHELRFVLTAHFVRIFATTALTGLMWHLALPQIALSWWVLLSAIRLLLSRLPFLPNKDFVFAGLAVLLIGHDSEIAALMTMMASLYLATHLLLGLLLMGVELGRAREPG